MKRPFPILFLAFAMMLMAGCKENNHDEVAVVNTHNSKCLLHSMKGYENPDTLSVTYADGIIHVTHENLMINCAASEVENGVEVTIEVEGSTIHIYETERKGLLQTDCLCEVDNHFDITGIGHGTYTLVMHSWYPNTQSFTFTF